MMIRHFPALLAALAALAPHVAAAQELPAPPPVAPAARSAPLNGCTVRSIADLKRNPTPAELRCRYRASGPGLFGLLSYLDVPVYQPATPLPGTHVVGVPGMPRPEPGESYEHWEWRIHRATFGPEARQVYRDMALMDPIIASKLMRMERILASRGVRVRRRETWRSPQRQAWLFQQGRSRPGFFATSTLTSWHCRVDRMGRAAARAADYDVPARQMPHFHQAALEVGLESYGADSNDPGHVYLPDTDAAAGLELAVLRLIPRVPHVTLATGRPDGEGWTGGLPRWRELTQIFIAEPFSPVPVEELAYAAAPPAPRPIIIPTPPPPPAPPRKRG
ncbi:MAG TPA: hypothetical protein VE913_14035 [Longimicrobium sp.]|nr:hypothetical protein [Longimicrobium sp.]